MLGERGATDLSLTSKRKRNRLGPADPDPRPPALATTNDLRPATSGSPHDLRPTTCDGRPTAQPRFTIYDSPFTIHGPSPPLVPNRRFPYHSASAGERAGEIGLPVLRHPGLPAFQSPGLPAESQGGAAVMTEPERQSPRRAFPPVTDHAPRQLPPGTETAAAGRSWWGAGREPLERWDGRTLGRGAAGPSLATRHGSRVTETAAVGRAVTAVPRHSSQITCHRSSHPLPVTRHGSFPSRTDCCSPFAENRRDVRTLGRNASCRPNDSRFTIHGSLAVTGDR